MNPLFLTKAVLVIGVGYGVHAVADAGKLLPPPGQGSAPIVGGVPHGIVGNGLAVVAGELVPPLGVCVAVGNRLRRRAGVLRRCVGVDALALDVPPAVVDIRHRLIREAVVLPNQLVGAVVLVGDGGAPLSD